MSAIVRALCPLCGEVDVLPRDMTVTVCSDRARSTYRFMCPRCAVLVRKSACEHVLSLLAVPGVVFEHLDVPAEALEPHPGPTLTADDLLDLLLDLAQL